MKTISFIAMLVLFGNCNHVNNSFEINDARLVAENLIGLMKLHQYDKISTYYSKDFFTIITEEQWRDDLIKIDQKFGDIESYELKSTGVSFEEDAFFITLIYDVKRKSYTTTETFIVFRSENSTRIASHHIKI